MSKALKILIVEDSEDDLFLLLHELRKGGYEPDYLNVCTAKAMSLALADRKWDVITSDYNMPGFSALGALQIVQESGLDIPLIVVSGKIGEDQAVAAMKAGANDYVMKQNLSRLAPALEREIKDAGERRMRREAEIALSKQFAQFRTIFDAMSAIVYVADMNSYELLYMNRYAMTIFGENWQGQSCYKLMQAERESPCDFCTNKELVQEGVPQPAVTSEHFNQKTGRWYQWTDRAIEWTDGKLVRLQIAVDISDIKEMERIKDEMISAVSHEMRTPLTAMLGFTEFLLENEVEQDKQRSILETIHKESARLNDLIGNFLDMQRIRGENSVIAAARVAPADIINDAARLFSCSKDMHRFNIDCPADLPLIAADAEKLHQVMLNLLSNACKYSPAWSQINISARCAAGEIIFAVEDEGIGIPADLRLKVFDRFYRIDNSDRRMVGGTGLGLALVKEIVDAHSGRVWIEANSPVGCKVMFTIPVG